MQFPDDGKSNQKLKVKTELQKSTGDDFEDGLMQNKCPDCGHGISPTADICEHCGAWLLKGKCNFCYAEVEPGQKFCSECGNPPEGIVCKSCGTLSHFDFCPGCNAALTEQANETIHLIKSSAEFQHLSKIFENENAGINKGAIQPDIELEKLKIYLSKCSGQKQQKKSTFSLTENSDSKVEDQIKVIEQSRQNIAMLEQNLLLQNQQEIQLFKLIEEAKGKVFSDNQAARKFFGALKILLPQVIQKRTMEGWKCNAYGCIHAGGPQECADPSAGGIWLYSTTSETSFKETEI